MKTLSILMVEDSEDDACLITDALRRHELPFETRRVMTADGFRKALKTADWDVVLCDYSLPAFDANEALEIVGETGRDIPVIIVSGTIGEEVAVETLKQGANDYILKQNLTRLGPAIEHELRDADDRHQRRVLEAFSAGQGEVLQRILENRPLSEILDYLAHCIEDLPLSASTPLSSILLTDADGTHLMLGAAPNLPEPFRQAIRDRPIPIEKGMGSSAAAALHRRMAIANDISVDPAWEHVREFSLEQGLRACWSVPVFSSGGAVLGTVAVYAQTVRPPAKGEIKWIEAAAKLVALAVERSRTAEELRERESLLQIAGRIALFGGWEVDLKSERVFWSDQVCAIHDCPPGTRPTLQEGIGYYAPECRDRIREAFEACARDGTPFDEELEIITTTGRRVWVRSLGEAMYDVSGRVARVRGAFQDITEKKKAEWETRRLAERLTTTLESITDGFFTLDRQWRFSYVNSEAEKLLQSSSGQLLGKVVWEEFQPAAGTTFEHEYRRALRENRTVSFEEFYPPLGIWFEVRAYPSEEGLAVYFRDVTERKNTESRLAEQAALLDKAQDAILVLDLEGHVKFWNKSAERLYGWTAEEAVGHDVRTFLYPSTEAFDEANQATLANGEWTGELSQVRKDGEAILVEARRSLVRGADGSPSSVLAINTDITERKKLEQQFLRSQRMEGIGTLAGGIAHDLNNVLSPILMSIELLRQGSIDDDDLQILDTIETSAQRGADMVRQVLAFARGAHGERIPTPPKHILNDVVRIVSDTFPKNIEVNVRVAPDVRSVLGDPTQLNQVLLNLCVNARDAMPEGGELTLSAENVNLDESFVRIHKEGTPGSYVLIAVSDTGIGIAEDILPKIFDPFFTTKRIGEGTGLGLATVNSIVRGHGGFTRIESDLGRGTVFHLYFPDAGTRTRPHKPASPVNLPRGTGECVLVVDDEASVRTMTRQTLEAFGYRVLLAANGADALDRFKEDRTTIHLVLTDMMMPVMDGPAMIEALRAEDPHLPVIAASGHNSMEENTDPAALGAAAFLAKPFTAEKLLTTVKEVLNAHKMPVPPERG